MRASTRVAMNRAVRTGVAPQGQFGHLDDASAMGDLDAPACAGGLDLVGAGRPSGVDHDLDAVAPHPSPLIGVSVPRSHCFRSGRSSCCGSSCTPCVITCPAQRRSTLPFPAQCPRCSLRCCDHGQSWRLVRAASGSVRCLGGAATRRSRAGMGLSKPRAVRARPDLLTDFQRLLTTLGIGVRWPDQLRSQQR